MTENQRKFRRPTGVEVQYRRVRFPFEDAGFARYWHGGSAFKSLFWSQLSTSFDAGERFFIDSARALKSEITDPALHAEYLEFCKQEGHHTAQHLKFDRMNAALGVDVEACRRRYNRALTRARTKLTPLGMLAVTVALEHFTAGFAELHFERPDFSADGDPNVVALWHWHAMEETEHKATCYDIYRAAGGGYLRRCVIMPGAWGLILWLSLVNTLDLLRKDKRLWTRDTLRGLAYLFGPRGMVSGLLPKFLTFFRPRWHPWQSDNSQEIGRWLRENSSYLSDDRVPAVAHAPDLPASDAPELRPNEAV
jgi:predicted metal-dependent hydrolase